VVIGLGTIGQEVVQVLNAYGAGRVIGLDLSPLRLQAAAELGAEAVDGSPGLDEALAPVLGGDTEIDVIFECSGIPALGATALDLVKGGGTIVVLALYDDPVTFDPTVLVQKEIRMQGSIAYTSDDFGEAVALLSRGAVRFAPLITQRERLEDIAGAFSIQMEKDRSLKVLIVPNGA
jgi:threonine dehydrogenase-like Zn-dependent dehydrogenase